MTLVDMINLRKHTLKISMPWGKTRSPSEGDEQVFRIVVRVSVE